MVDRAESVRVRWAHPVRDEIFTLAITDDGDRIFAGGDGVLYCFDQQGNLIWRGGLEGIALTLARAEGSSHLIVGSTNGKAYIWTYQGSLVQVLDMAAPICELSVTPTGYRIALGTLEGRLSLYDITGRQLWQQTLPGAIRSLALAPDGSVLVAGCEDGGVYCLDGNGASQWKFFTRDRLWAGATLASSYVLAGSDDKHVYCLDRGGHPLWSFDTGAIVNRVVLTADGEAAAAGGHSERVWVWQQNGTLRWESATPGTVTGLALAREGDFVVVATSQQAVVLFDERGQQLGKLEMQDKVYAVAMTPYGRLIAAIAADHTLSLIENQLVSVDAEQKANERLIRRLRQHSLMNRHAGLALWLRHCDQALLERRFGLCKRLFAEMAEGGYHLEEEEQRWLAQREGLFWLYQGMRYQQQHEVEQARQAYERSKACYQRVRDWQDEGQTLMALNLLERQPNERHPGWLSLLTSLPQAAGNSEQLLTRRIQQTQEMVEQYQLVLTAQQLGLMQPLLAAQSSPHTLVQTTAAAALPWLQPGPAPEMLLDLLASEQWIVRWQALVMLTQRMQQLPRTLAPYRERLRRHINEMLTHEEIPAVLRSVIVLVRTIGEAALEANLLPFLHDPDLEVRLETVLTLKIIGTRAALPGLRSVRAGTTALERLVNDWAALARQDIRQRIPLARVEQVVCCAERGRRIPTDTFVTDNPQVHCVVALTQITAGLRVRCTLTAKGQEPMEQEIQLGTRSLRHEAQSNARQSLRDWLYRLFAEEDLAFWSWREDEDELNQQDSKTQGTEVVFSFAPDRGTWFPGIYRVEIALNDIVAYRRIFKVMSREAALFAPHYYSKGEFSQRQHSYQEALLDYAQTLKFDAYHIQALCNSADIWLIRGSLQQATATYVRALQLDANTLLNHFVTAGVAHALAVNCLEELYAVLLPTLLGGLDPQLQQHIPARLLQLSMAVLTWPVAGQTAAQDVLAALIQAPAETPEDRFACIIALALLGRQAEGRAMLEQLPEQTGRTVTHIILHSCALALLGLGDAALSLLDTALFADPDTLILQSLKALIYLRLQQQADALNVLEHALILAPDSLMLLALQCFVLFKLERKEDVLRCCQHMIDVNPHLALPYLLKAGALALLGEYEGALRWIDVTLTRTPDNVPASVLALYALIQLKRNEQARQRYEQLTARFPTLPLAHLLYADKIALDK